MDLDRHGHAEGRPQLRAYLGRPEKELGFGRPFFVVKLDQGKLLQITEPPSGGSGPAAPIRGLRRVNRLLELRNGGPPRLQRRVVLLILTDALRADAVPSY
jgi:hypothetical protein